MSDIRRLHERIADLECQLSMKMEQHSLALARAEKAEAQIVRLTTVLEEIANQDLRQEIDAEDWDNIDWEEGYEDCVMAARATLKEQGQ